MSEFKNLFGKMPFPEDLPSPESLREQLAAVPVSFSVMEGEFRYRLERMEKRTQRMQFINANIAEGRDKIVESISPVLGEFLKRVASGSASRIDPDAAMTYELGINVCKELSTAFPTCTLADLKTIDQHPVILKFFPGTPGRVGEDKEFFLTRLKTFASRKAVSNVVDQIDAYKKYDDMEILSKEDQARDDAATFWYGEIGDVALSVCGGTES